MKIFRSLTFILLFIPSSFIVAQSQAFVFTLYGGLFLPSNIDFRSNYKSNSDLIWGGGIGLPMSSTLFATGDLSYFNVKGIADPVIDSTLKLEERFIHIGVLNKQPLTGNFFVRLSGGISYTTIKQKYSSSGSSEITVDADKKLGYYGGIGIEQPLDPQGHLSIFADAVYDYRRSGRKELFGDFGGIRVILGVHMIMF
ncbi:MAG: hypothetical protein HZB59_08525 [Ignavibacteriales bacterium]|nr:hypothetical protein [Ignavibacteriales bacterium]